MKGRREGSAKRQTLLFMLGVLLGSSHVNRFREHLTCVQTCLSRNAERASTHEARHSRSSAAPQTNSRTCNIFAFTGKNKEHVSQLYSSLMERELLRKMSSPLGFRVAEGLAENMEVLKRVSLYETSTLTICLVSATKWVGQWGQLSKGN